MPVELRKRKAPAEQAPPPPAKKKSNPVKNAMSKAKAAVTGGQKGSTTTNGATGPPAVGSVISLDDFGGEIETNDGGKTTLKKLVDDSKAGVVLFTYPKASTPGCTTQACMFRDDYAPLTATGLSIYGLSKDSPKANTTFKTKQSLPYPLLCDQSSTLISAIGLKKAPSGTTRGVFAIDKQGKVLVSEPGGPAATVAAIKKLVGSENTTSEVPETKATEPTPDSTKMDVDSVPAATEPVAEPAKVSEPVSDAVPVAPDTKTTSATEPEAAATAPSDAPVAANSSTNATVNGAEPAKDDVEKAEIAADVADTAAKLDTTPNPA